MSGSQFSITNAIRNAYAFLGRHGGEVLRLSILPVGIGVATQVFIFYQRPTGSAFEGYLISIPATVLHGWFMFTIVRLLLLGEHVNALPQDREYLLDRRNALRASVLVWLLFNAGCTAVLGFQEWAMQTASTAQSTLANAISLLLIVLGIWGIRFAVAHILAAVDYSIKTYIFVVNGVSISLRLAGLGIMTALPVLIAFYCIIKVVAPDMKDGDPGLALLISLLAPLSFIITAILTPAACFALKEILGRVPARNNSGTIA